MADNPHVMYPVMSAVTMQLLRCINDEVVSSCLFYFAAEHKIYYMIMQVARKWKNACIPKCAANLD